MMHMKSPPIIIVLGLKGGSGKSTLAIHLAVCSKRRALLADTDPQATLVA
jgi:cellulose biosynthesis protein BcsQ